MRPMFSNFMTVHTIRLIGAQFHPTFNRTTPPINSCFRVPTFVFSILSNCNKMHIFQPSELAFYLFIECLFPLTIRSKHDSTRYFQVNLCCILPSSSFKNTPTLTRRAHVSSQPLLSPVGYSTCSVGSTFIPLRELAFQ